MTGNNCMCEHSYYGSSFANTAQTRCDQPEKKNTQSKIFMEFYILIMRKLTFHIFLSVKSIGQK